MTGVLSRERRVLTHPRKKTLVGGMGGKKKRRMCRSEKPGEGQWG